MKNKKLQKFCLSFKMSGTLAEATQRDLTDGMCQMDEWERRKKGLSKYLIVVLAKSYLYANFPDSSSFQMF